MDVPDKMKYNFFEIDKHGNLKKTDKNPNEKRAKVKRGFFSEYININVGYSLITPLLLGVIVGLTLDNRFKSKPFFTVFFIFLGMVSSLYNLFKIIK